MRTIEWDAGVVRLVDQTKLPQEYIILEYNDYLGVGKAIKEMEIRGAPAIGAAAAFGMALAAVKSKAVTRDEFLRDLEEMAEYVVTLRGEPVAVLRPLTEEESQRLRGGVIDETLAEMRALAQQVGAGWTSPKSGVELVDEQRR